MKRLFFLRSEYREYCEECYNANETPWSFRDWFEVCYHYDMADNLPTGYSFDGSFTGYSLASMN